MARDFRKGVDVIKASAENKGNRKFTPNIYWKPGDVRTIAWVTAADEIPKVRLHQMVKIPDDSRESGIRYETFLCKKDPALIEESGGVCDLCDRVGAEPAEKFVALAIELEPVKEGKKITELKVKKDVVKRDDGTEAEYARWGLVIQASKNFFSYFAAYDSSKGDIRDVAWEIQREGGSTDTKYHPYIVMNGTSAVSLPDLAEVIENAPTLEELLDEMASDEKYAQTEELAPGSQPGFGGAKKSEPSGTVPTGDRQTQFAKIKDEVVSSY
jgi:hypothetical protein